MAPSLLEDIVKRPAGAQRVPTGPVSNCKVKAILRVRPFLSTESSSTHKVVDLHDDTVRIANPRNPTELLSYRFDGCYGPDATQKQLFVRNVRPLVDRALDGYNVTIFAYGMTGAGKTFTMEGSDSHPGTKWSTSLLNIA